LGECALDASHNIGANFGIGGFFDDKFSVGRELVVFGIAFDAINYFLGIDGSALVKT
jgi:hypothetical protein